MKASILINTYNHGELLEEAVESALKQSISRDSYEIIVVDDGSTDDTSERVKKYQDRIIFLQQKNAGQGAAMNTAIKHARGEILVFLDGDDRMTAKRLEKVIEAFEDPEVIIALNARMLFSGDGNEFPGERYSSGTLIPSRATVTDYYRVTYGTSRTAVRASGMREILPVPEGAAICADVSLMALCWYGKLAVLSDPLTEYRVHSGNRFHSGTASSLDRRIADYGTYLSAYRERARKGKYFNPELLDDVSFIFDYEIKELFYNRLLIDQKAKRKDLLEKEIRIWKRFNCGWTYSEKLSHWVKMVVKTVVGPKRLAKFRN